MIVRRVWSSAEVRWVLWRDERHWISFVKSKYKIFTLLHPSVFMNPHLHLAQVRILASDIFSSLKYDEITSINTRSHPYMREYLKPLISILRLNDIWIFCHYFQFYYGYLLGYYYSINYRDMEPGTRSQGDKEPGTLDFAGAKGVPYHYRKVPIKLSGISALQVLLSS